MAWVDDLTGKVVALDTGPLIYFIEEHPTYLPPAGYEAWPEFAPTRQLKFLMDQTRFSRCSFAVSIDAVAAIA